MSNLIFYIFFIFLCFAILTISIKIVPKEAMFTIAIGAVIGSNIYNPIDYPIEIFGISFGIDSIVYSLFMFCLLLVYIDYGKKDFTNLLYTSLFSILFTAFLYFMGKYSQTGYTTNLLFTTISYINSMIGTLIAALVMRKSFDFFKKKKVNIYLNIFLCMLIASVINSLIYFLLSYLFNKEIINTMLISLLGSYIGKFIVSTLCLLVYFFHTNNEHKTDNNSLTLNK